MGIISGRREDGGQEEFRADSDGRLPVIADAAAPVYVASVPGGSPVSVSTDDGVAQTQDVTWSLAVTGSSQSKKLPKKDGLYLLQSRGDDVFIETADGSAPTVVLAAAGFSLMVLDGKTIKVRLAGDYIAWIGTTTGGFLTCCLIEE